MTPLDEASAVALLQGVDHILPRLPEDRSWWRTTWGALNSSLLRHIFSECWSELSEKTGRLTRTAERLGGCLDDSDPSKQIRSIAAKFDGARCGALLLGANDLEAGPFIVMDGNHRATALILREQQGDPVAAATIPVVVAQSAKRIWTWEEE